MRGSVRRRELINCNALDYSRYANLIAETLLTRVRGDFAEERFAAATTAAALAWLSAGSPVLDAVASRLAGQSETSQCHSYKAAGESFQGLPPRFGLRHNFRQLIEFVVHSFIPFRHFEVCNTRTLHL